MPYSYKERVKQCIKAALRECPCTLEEIIKKCHGAYPTIVNELLTESSIYSKLVPLYTTSQESIPYFVQDSEMDYKKTDLITYSLENNPALSSWYFSWETCSRISMMDLWKEKRILFMGTPRLFEFFQVHNKAGKLTLVDLDSTVIAKLKEKYGHKEGVSVVLADTQQWTPKGQYYDAVFLDPPWYIDAYLSWLPKALGACKSSGIVAFSLFPYLIRPTASKERETIYNYCRSIADSVFTISEWLEYDVPTFEKKQLELCNVELKSNWKVSDFVLVSGIKNEKIPSREINYPASPQWKEVNLFGARWFVNLPNKKDLETKNTALLQVLGDSLYLSSPSHRNEQFKKANLLSSRGHGLFVRDPQRFINLAENIKNKSAEGIPLQDILCESNIDRESIDIIKRIAEGLK